MNGMQGLVMGVAVGSVVAGGIAMLALQGAPPPAALEGPAGPGLGGAEVTPEALAQLRQDAARAGQLQQELDAAKASAGAAGGTAGAAEAELREHVRSLRAEIALLKTERSELEVQLREAEQAAGTAAETDAPKPGTFRFGIKAKSPIFEKQNWAELGGHVAAMLQDIPAFAQGMVDTGKPDMEIMKRLAPHNQPLATLTMAAQGEIEGTGFNGPFTHPAVMANLLSAALESAGLPLNDAQLKAIAGLGADWDRSWAQTKSAHTDSTLALVKIADEVDAKQRFLESVRALLTPEQLASTSPPSTRDRLQLDLFSPVFVWQMRQARTGTDREALKPQLLTALLGEAKAADVTTEALDDIAERWLQAYGHAYLAPVPARGWDMLFVTVQRTQAAARAQAAAAQELLARGQLTPEQSTALRDHSTLYTPYITKPD